MEDAVGLLERLDALFREALPLEADGIHLVGFHSALRRAPHERQDVPVHPRERADEGVAPDPEELADGRVAAEDHVVLDDAVAREGHSVREDGAVPDDAVVCNVRVRHEEVVVADDGRLVPRDGSAMDRAELTEDVPVADHERRRLALVLEVLRRPAERGQLEDPVVLADRRGALDHGMRADGRTRSDRDVGADDRVGADVGGRVDGSGRVHDGGRVDRHQAAPGRLTRLDMATVSAQRTPSTRASPLIFTRPIFTFRISMVAMSWSPGKTGRRKRALSMPER